MRLPEIMEGWVGRSRIEAARLAERHHCAKVVENYRKQISTWTAADDCSSPGQHTAVYAALEEVERRIRARK